MALTLAQLATKALRDVQISEDSNTPNVTALADAKAYMNEAHADIWSRRVWRESLILGTFAVPASTTRIALSDIVVDAGYSTSANGYNASFTEIMGVREGNIPYRVEDATALNAFDVNSWTKTTKPISFINRGQSGILLLGQFSESTTLSFIGKAASQDIGASESWILDGQGQALIEQACGCFIRDHDRDDERANIRFQAASAQVQKLIDLQTIQGANVLRLVPINPWTGLASEVVANQNTVTGFPTIF